MELVDIVDTNGMPLYQTTKEEAHEKGLLHKCVIAEVKTSQGKWLLVKQANDRQDAGQFVSPVGGHISANELPENALIRETQEELGMSLAHHTYIGDGIFDRMTRGKRENHYFMLYEISTDAIPALNHESIEYKYFSNEEIRTGAQDNPKQFGDAFLFILHKFYPNLLE